MKTILASSAFLVAGIAICLAISAQAAEFVRQGRVSDNSPAIVTITGALVEDDEKKFHELTVGFTDLIVILNSKGGLNRPAALIGNRIWTMGYSTRLHSGSICNSACTLIFFAGIYRHMDKGTRLGFHSAWARKDGRPIRAEETNRKIGEYLAKLGVPQQIIDLQPKADPCCLNYVTYDQAKVWGALKERPSASSSPTSAGTSQAGAPAKVEEPPLAAPPKITDRFDPGGQQTPATSAPGAQPAVTAAQKVVLYEEDPADPNAKRFVGSAIWRTEMVTAGLGQPPQLAIRADIEVPERKLAVTWSLRCNTDKGLPATHTVEIMFKTPADFPAGAISNVPGILMKQAESTRGVPLAGLAVKVTPGFYMIGLSNLDADKERNLQLLMERGWFDIPVVYSNNRRAVLAMEKGAPGERAFADAFKAWNQ